MQVSFVLFFALFLYFGTKFGQFHNLARIDIPPSNPNFDIYGDLEEDYLDITTSMSMRYCIKKDMKIDIAFVLDCTGSMAAHLSAASKSIVTLMNKLKEKLESESRLALIKYSDSQLHDPNRFQILPFTENSTTVTNYLSTSCRRSPGNSDLPEDAFGALNEAVNFNWTAPNRIIFHIADAPGHGNRFNPSDPAYPNGKPGDPKPEELITQMKNKSIHYVLGEINKQQTKKMLDFFKEHAKSLGNDEMIDSVDIKDSSKVLNATLTATSDLINNNCRKKTTSAPSATTTISDSITNLCDECIINFKVASWP